MAFPSIRAGWRRTFLLGLACLGLLAGTAAQAQTLQKIKQSGELKIGVAAGDPWYFRDPVSGQWTGVGVLVGEQIGKAMGVKTVPVETTWGNSVAALQSGQIDVMFVLDATEERKRAIDFPATPLLWYAQGVLAKDGLALQPGQLVSLGSFTPLTPPADGLTVLATYHGLPDALPVVVSFHKPDRLTGCAIGPQTEEARQVACYRPFIR